MDDLIAPERIWLSVEQATDAANQPAENLYEYALATAQADKAAIRALIGAAYIQGATDVHENWQADKAPDFTEAASDYAALALLDAPAAQPGEGGA